MTTSVEAVVKAFEKGIIDAQDGAKTMTESVLAVTGSFEPTGKVIKVAFEDGGDAAKKIYRAVIKFVPILPKQVGEALLGVFSDMRDDVIKVVA